MSCGALIVGIVTARLPCVGQTSIPRRETALAPGAVGMLFAPVPRVITVAGGTGGSTVEVSSEGPADLVLCQDCQRNKVCRVKTKHYVQCEYFWGKDRPGYWGGRHVR